MLRALLFAALFAALLAALFWSQSRTGPEKVSGFVEADEIRLGSRVGGRVARVLAAEGALVKRGDLLLELEPFDLLERRAQAQAAAAERRAELDRLAAGFRPEEVAQARARTDALEARLALLVAGPRRQEIAAAEAQGALARAQVDLARIELDRRKTLVAGDVESRQALDRATAEAQGAEAALAVRAEELSALREGSRKEDVDAARAELAQARAALDLVERGYRAEDVEAARAALDSAEAALRALDRQVAELRVEATCDGVVDALDLQPGEIVQPNAPVVSLIDARSMWVRAYVPESRLSLQEGQAVEVGVDSFPGERFAGRVRFVSRQAEFTPGNVQTPEERSKQVFRIKVALESGLDRLRPGMAADVYTGR